MKTNIKKQKQIAKRLIVYIILFSSAITLITTAVQLYSEYSRDISDIDKRINQIKTSYSQSISAALWVLDKDQLLTILDGITALPYIEYAEVRAENKFYVYSGLPPIDNNVTVNFPLYHQHRSTLRTIGEMHIEASLSDVYSRLLHRVMTILISNGIKTFLVALFLFIVFRRLVTRHLTKISNFAMTRNINDLSHRITLDRQSDNHSKDEIDIVVDSLNSMQENLATSISNLKNSEEQLFKEKELLQVTLHSIADAVITTNADGIVQYMNPTAEELTGWIGSEAIDRPFTEVFSIINELTREVEENPVRKCLYADNIVAMVNHTALVRRDGREISIEDSAAPIRNKEGQIIGVVLVFHDVSDERELRQQLSFQASHDSLTGLENRRELERRLALALASAKKHGLSHALIYLDLDQFKIVNDTCGHVAGDEILRQLSMVLKKHMRTGDTLGRLGGDEFGILLENCSLDNAHRVAENYCQIVKDFRFVWQDKSFDISASIGVSGMTALSKSTASILSAADIACYAAKESGRNRVHVYTEENEELAQRQGEMARVAQIKTALEEDRFCLYVQPIVGLNENNSTYNHYEVLVRLIDEQGELVAPGVFIPAAERYDLMPAIDRWVIHNAFSYCHNYGEPDMDCTLAINLSGTSLNDPSFPDYIKEQFQIHNISPNNICFEITETAAIANLVNAASFILYFKKMGCRFSLDDFGSGVSSFAYLKNLPVDYLKIDGCFVMDMVDDPIDCAMVESITKIGHVMGLQTIAEFVETDAIIAELQKIGVDYAQGFGVCKPIPLSEISIRKKINHAN